MLDYIFFDSKLSGKFKNHLTKVGIEFKSENDENFGSVQGEIVSIDDDTQDDVLEDLQALYEDLQDELEKMLEQTEDALIMNAAGMEVKLKDGSICTLRVSPDVITRILSVLEFEELQAFVDNIAKSVEDPDSGHFCHNK
jgi:molybdopterin converting factor small subunit